MIILFVYFYFVGVSYIYICASFSWKTEFFFRYDRKFTIQSTVHFNI
jgi:hypothetical protein